MAGDRGWKLDVPTYEGGRPELTRGGNGLRSGPKASTPREAAMATSEQATLE